MLRFWSPVKENTILALFVSKLLRRRHV